MHPPYCLQIVLVLRLFESRMQKSSAAESSLPRTQIYQEQEKVDNCYSFGYMVRKKTRLRDTRKQDEINKSTCLLHSKQEVIKPGKVN